MARKKESAVVVGDARRKRFGRKQIVLLVLILIVVVAGGIIVGVLRHNHQQQVAQKNQREALVTQAAPYLGTSDLAKLAPIAAKIKQQPGYATDVDSLYVLTTYYLNGTDTQNSKTYYTKLSQLYNAKVGYANPSLKGAQTPAQLKSYYTFVQDQAANVNYWKLPAKP